MPPRRLPEFAHFVVDIVTDYDDTKSSLKFKLPDTSIYSDGAWHVSVKDVYTEVARRLGPGVPFNLGKTPSTWSLDDESWVTPLPASGTRNPICPSRFIPGLISRPSKPIRLVARKYADSKLTRYQHWFDGKWRSAGKMGVRCPRMPRPYRRR